MAAAPQFKVFSPAKEYVAAFKHLEDAAVLVAFYGNGATVKHEHRLVLWTEGMEGQSAGESYDDAAKIMRQRLAAAQRQSFTAAYGYAP